MEYGVHFEEEGKVEIPWKVEKLLTSLDSAVDEMLDFNKRFIMDILKPLKSFEQRNVDAVLHQQFSLSCKWTNS